jgi:hypothetical protein
VGADQEVPALLGAVRVGLAGIARVPAVHAARLAWGLPVAAAVAAEAEAGGGRNL